MALRGGGGDAAAAAALSVRAGSTALSLATALKEDGGQQRRGSQAQRLIEKAQRMFPSAEGQALAAACAQRLSGGPASSPSAETGSQRAAPKGGEAKGPQQGARQRKGSPVAGASRGSNGADARLTRSRSAAAASASAAPAAHTPEQATFCETVLRETCYYKVLGVSKDSSEDAIRKAYKRLALVLHPDKNKAPKAEDAFKKLNKVSSTLLDPHERRKYDVGGEEALDGRAAPHMQRAGAPHPDIMTAEDLFRVLFGQSLRDGGRGAQARGGRQHTHHQEHNFHALVQFLPMILLLLMMLLFNLMPQDGSTPPVYYSFRQSREFPVPRTTQMHSVRYFVGDGFMQEILPQPEKVRELERKVEVRHYQGICTSENDRLNRDLTTAHYHMASNESIKRLLDRPRPGCMKLELLKTAMGPSNWPLHLMPALLLRQTHQAVFLRIGVLTAEEEEAAFVFLSQEESAMPYKLVSLDHGNKIGSRRCSSVARRAPQLSGGEAGRTSRAKRSMRTAGLKLGA
ncbi:hypothetical protein Efla_006114 [Eimeria flavescens]